MDLYSAQRDSMLSSKLMQQIKSWISIGSINLHRRKDLPRNPVTGPNRLFSYPYQQLSSMIQNTNLLQSCNNAKKSQAGFSKNNFS